MKIITFFVLAVYMCLVGDALRMRENLNVLIPNNNVNRHEQLKSILRYDLDPNDFIINDYDIVSNPIVERIVEYNNLPLVEPINRSSEESNDRNESNRETDNNREATISHGSTSNERTTTSHGSTSNERGTTDGGTTIENETTKGSKKDGRSDERTTAQPTTQMINTTTKMPILSNPSSEAACLLGNANENLKWIGENGTLNKDFIWNEEKFKNLKLLDKSMSSEREKDEPIKNIEILSLAFNDFKQIPSHILDPSQFSLQFLTLMGNDFKDLIASSINLPNLKELDLRNCKLRTIHKPLLEKLKNLEYLCLSSNFIASLDDDSFNIPSLTYLDLSYNQENALIGDLPSPLKVTLNVFRKLKNLQFLDLSHTKLETKAIASLNELPPSLIGISLCYTELISNGDNFLSNLTKLKLLDISGNTQLNFTKSMFHTISATLERLDARDANVEQLIWLKPLINLRVLNINDNKIRYLDNNSFSHMLYLKDLNLEKNSVGNWYSKLFAQNQELETLNLRENTLTMLTEDMMEDLLSVRHLAIGKNKFECNCDLYSFMVVLFESTKDANITELQDRFNFNRFQSETSTSHSVSMGLRSNLRPEYDIISRTYEKYYEQILRSIEALKKNNYKRKSKSLISLSEAKSLSESTFHTILLDYDENNEDYQCMNVTEKQKQSMLDLIELCHDLAFHATDPKDVDVDDLVIITLSASIPLVIIFFLLLFLIYWKWWYIRYFFILCKNSAILTFMKDNDDGKETIVKRTSTHSLDLFVYDVFVSYSDYNRSWVLDEFIPNIERRESINVCLHERDFTVGYGILENIISCMDKSRCLLLLISEKFLESQWCQFEMNLAQHRLLETRKEKLIVVLLEDVPIQNQPKTLRYLMRTKTYIKWPERGSNDEKQLFWRRLKKSIISTKWEHESYGTTV